MKQTAIIMLNIHKRNVVKDIEVPLDITANEFVIALNVAYGLGIDVDDIRNCYLKMDNPAALLHGNTTLKEYGMHECSIIHITD